MKDLWRTREKFSICDVNGSDQFLVGFSSELDRQKVLKGWIWPIPGYYCRQKLALALRKQSCSPLFATFFSWISMQSLCPNSYFMEYKGKLNRVAGSKKAATIIKGALYLLSAGNSDFVQNYYVNPFVNELYTPDQYGDILVCAFTRFIMVPCQITTSVNPTLMKNLLSILVY